MYLQITADVSNACMKTDEKVTFVFAFLGKWPVCTILIYDLSAN